MEDVVSCRRTACGVVLAALVLLLGCADARSREPISGRYALDQSEFASVLRSAYERKWRSEVYVIDGGCEEAESRHAAIAEMVRLEAQGTASLTLSPSGVFLLEFGGSLWILPDARGSWSSAGGRVLLSVLEARSAKWWTTPRSENQWERMSGQTTVLLLTRVGCDLEWLLPVVGGLKDVKVVLRRTPMGQ